VAARAREPDIVVPVPADATPPDPPLCAGTDPAGFAAGSQTSWIEPYPLPRNHGLRRSGAY
jgi:hypothetical protein